MVTKLPDFVRLFISEPVAYAKTPDFEEKLNQCPIAGNQPSLWAHSSFQEYIPVNDFPPQTMFATLRSVVRQEFVLTTTHLPIGSHQPEFTLRLP